MTETQQLILDHLQQISLFEPLSPDDLKALAQRIQITRYPEGHKLFLQGDPGDSFYVVHRGEVEITLRYEADSALEAPHRVRVLMRPDSFFGEMSLLTGQERTGDARVLEDSQLIEISKSDFQEILLKNPAIASKLSVVLVTLMANDENVRAQIKARQETSPSATGIFRGIKDFFGLTD